MIFANKGHLCKANTCVCVLGGFATAHGGPRNPDTGRENFIWPKRHVHSDVHHQL